MAHQPKKDPFAPIALLIGLAILGTAVFVLVSNLISTISRNSTKGVEDNSRAMAIADESLKPIGNVTAVDKSKAKVARKGDEVYKAVCTSCHGTGVLGAPKFGSKDQWAPRVANGLPALIKSATNGKGSMPPRGGDPSITDEELKAAIVYMTKESGFNLADASADGAAPAKKDADNASSATLAEKPVAPAQPQPATEPVKPATPTKPSAPAAPADAKTDVATPIAAAATAIKAAPTAAPQEETKAVEKAPEAPAAPKEETKAVEKAPEAPAMPKEETKAVEKTPEAPAMPKEETKAVEKAPQVPAAPKEETKVVEKTPEAPAAPKEEKKAEPKKVAEAPKANGEAVYNTTCFSCHATGVAGSPVFGNKELWAPRIATGMDALYHSAITGKGVMPPKGGNMSLSDDEVKAAVNYMVEHSK